MAHYSPRGFMRQVSNNLLQRYFRARDFDLAVDWDGLEETGIEPIFEAWMGLSEEDQRTADADFTEVSRLANEAGLAVLIEEGAWHNLDLAAEFAEIEDQTDAVMWTLLEHPTVFRVGSLFYAADAIAARSWQKWKGLPNDTPRDDAPARTELAAALREYFTKHEGRGRHCQVDVYQRHGSYYYFAFPEDYARAEQDFDEDGRLVRRTHRPVFQVVLVFSPERGTLDASAPGGKRVVEKLMNLAVSTLLPQDTRDTGNDDRVYELEGLRDENFRWRYSVDDGISAVWVKALRLSFKSGGDKLILEGKGAGGVHQLYNRLVATDYEPGRVAPDSVFVTQATVHVEYVPRGGQRVAARVFGLTWPNGCNLGQDPRDRALREMLITSGIDPAGIGRDERR